MPQERDAEREAEDGAVGEGAAGEAESWVVSGAPPVLPGS